MVHLRAGASAFRMCLKTRVVDPFTYLNWLVFPLIFSGVGLLLFTSRPGSAHIEYGVLGGGLIGFWTAAYLDGGNSINQERWEGTLEQLVGTPTPLAVILAGKIAACLLLGMVSFLPTLALAYLGFHARLPKLAPGPFAISFAVLTFSFFAVSIMFAPLFALWRAAFALTNGFELGLYVVSGFMFPVTVLAGWGQGVAAIVAPSWATRAIYASVTGGAAADYPRWWALSVLVSCVYLAISVGLFRVVHIRARISGQLAQA